MKKPNSSIIRLLIFILSLSILTLSSFSVAAATKPQELFGIDVKTDDNVERIAIRLSDYIRPQSTFFKDNLVIDFPNTVIKETLQKDYADSKFIYKIHAWQFKAKPYVARIVIEFKKEVAYDLYSLLGKNEVVVEIGDDVALPLHIAVSNPIRRAKLPGAVPHLESKTIVIDAGHGGIDPGGISCSGMPEKKFTLPVALELEALLKAAGARVIMTRRTDQTTDFRKISDRTNKLKADIFVGIHFNYFEDSSAAGTETFYYNPFSIELAQYVHSALVKKLKRRNRGVRKDVLYTVHHTDMPAILVEVLYITNPEEERLVKSNQYQKMIAKGLYNGLDKYFKSISR
ncbi:MAG: N-acetylmuramoyl-L-alanine amidase [Candidatus Margulisbacteria bacterium]|nr:N-acetylmuramoyl-L-alanine amidase [Candidatus Margulisiibacteriota bacterium]MBU1021785.1 N-acetylmuramoyl-L-alanine amidase [Candidatus Margulisiibacteriota bacterium]MBU1729531.1 N-acetylmuramoyl-L-alanine amidase [Candidatus Margulisiibacteriota bacterium]MBU1955368.1 N-acetylmuramoyl-L-alanine amidase [Candidatus Margulisiibacteriota bacterium]